MVRTSYGNFKDFCRDSTLPVCNLLSPTHTQRGPWRGCQLKGIPLSGDRILGNLGAIVLCGFAIATAALLIWRSERKKAAVGRREMQLFLLGYAIISICEIFSVGIFPLNATVRVAFSAVHIGMIVTTCWILMLNGFVGYQLMDDGTPMSLSLFLGSSVVLFLGTGYIAADTGYSWTGFWDSSYELPNRHYALYTLYQLVPLIFLVTFVLLESYIAIRVLGERRPMEWLTGAFILFVIGQIFNYAISRRLCRETDGKIDGSMFETFFTLLSVVAIWFFWSSITEDDWPIPAGGPPSAFN